MIHPAWRAAAIVLLLGLGGCTLGPDFLRPSPPEVPAYRNADQKDAAVSLSTNPDPRWWKGFNDPLLTEVIETAIRNNLDVQQAVLRVIESRQGIVTARSAAADAERDWQLHARTDRGARHPGV